MLRSTLGRQAERSDRGATHKALNLTYVAWENLYQIS